MTSGLLKLENAVGSTLKILDDNNQNKVFNKDLHSVARSVKQIAWKAKKLKISSERNAAVSVYGPSQVGKSFLASVLVRPNEDYLQIAFPQPTGNKNYIGEINPGGDHECTGIVTRFTIDENVGKKDFPVYLRLLSEIDIVCILTNSYFSEGDQKYESHKSSEEINDYLDAISVSSSCDNLEIEDFWELEEYLREQFGSFEYIKTVSPYIERIGAKALRATLQQRAQLFAPLWGFHKPFTNLFIKLIEALDQLQYGSEVYAEISALIPKSTSIIDVRLLSEIYSKNDDFVGVMTDHGEKIQMQRGLLSALTSELVLRVDGVPHDFFHHTDVLDFPGTRNRKAENLATIFDGKDDFKENIHQFFLRGKVAYLFDKYVNSQDINSMLLCIKDSNMEAVGLPNMVEKWVHNSIGSTAEKRKNKENNLFFVLTFFDKHLVDTTANRNETDRFQRRMKSSLLEMFGNHENTWVKNWSGTSKSPQPFKNCFLLRNPGAKQSYFEIDHQTGIESFVATEGQEARIAEIKNLFLNTAEVKAHFHEPIDAWNAVMVPNDGGTSYILNHLARVSEPNTKLNQLESLAFSLSEDLSNILRSYYVPTDVDEKKRVSREKFSELEKQVLDAADIVSKKRFSSFLETLCIDEEDLLAHLDGRFAHDISDYVGNSCNVWRDKMKNSIGQISKDFNILKSSLEFLAHEISLAMEINKIEQAIEDAVRFMNDGGLTGRNKTRAHEISAHVLNSFITECVAIDLGTSEILDLDSNRPNAQKKFAERWLEKIKQKVDENALSEGGLSIDHDTNSKLKEIIDTVGWFK